MIEGDVKGSGSSRRSKTRATRRRIIEAAAAQFIERGYSATTLEDVATGAGVAVQTVYFHFGNKRTVLHHAVDMAAAGDDLPVPLLERPWLEELREESDPERILFLWVRNGLEIFERIAPIMAVVRDAAAIDEDVAQQWHTNEEQRLRAFEVLAQILSSHGLLRPGLTVAEATDIVFALNSIEVYLLLTVKRGWSGQRWEQWLIDALRAGLLS